MLSLDPTHAPTSKDPTEPADPGQPGDLAQPADPTQPAGDPLAIWALLDSLDIAWFRIDHQAGRIVDATAAMMRLFGFKSREEALATPVVTHYSDPEERAEAAARIYGHPDVVRTGAVRVECQRLRKDTGEPIELLMSLRPRFDAAGKVVTVDGLFERREDRQGAEKAFRASEERFRAVFEASPIGMIFTDMDYRIVRVNAEFRRFSGRSESELMLTPLLSIVHPGHAAQVAAALLHGDDARAGAVVECQFVRQDGEIAWGDVHCTWLVEQGVPHSHVLFVTDVTERKRTAGAMLQLQKLEAVGLLAGGIAHDFNNLLTVVIGSLVLARQPDLAPDSQDLLKAAEDAARRATEVTQRLIAFANGGIPIKKPVAPAGLVAGLLALRPDWQSVRFDVADDLPVVDLDPAQIRQVVQHLVANAREAGEGAVDVTVTCEAVQGQGLLAPGRYLRLRVRDTGEGIAPEHLPLIFDAYFTTRDNHSGFGLPTVLAIVRRHGGHVEVTSVLGQGTTVTVHLPTSTAQPSVEQEPAASVPVAKASRRVLLMDDDVYVRKVAGELLRALDLEVVETRDGGEAITAFAQARESGRPFAFVVLDLTVHSGLGGLDTVRCLRAIDPAVLAVVSSGYSTDPVMADPHKHGFSAVIAKPYDLTELTAVVNQVLSMR